VQNESELQETQKLYISSTSKIKLQHFRDYFKNRNIEIIPLPLEIPEIQAIAPEEVVAAKLKLAESLTNLRPLVVDDVGLNVPSLQGFPGALLKPILELGQLHLLRNLLSSQLQINKVDAIFECAIGFSGTSHGSTTNSPIILKGQMQGHLNFSDTTFLNDRQTYRYFYPFKESESVYELQSVDMTRAFRHRFLAMQKLAYAINGQN
jgi:inosine/xanthosine triphosphate pyrophosphatase family protein